MTLKLTERDKKLLVFLAIFVLVVGIGVGVIYPLFNRSKSLEQELTSAQLQQTENEQKVSLAASMEMGKQKMLEEIADARKAFYEPMKSEKIDKMLTNMAVSRGVVVTDLDIAMPQKGSYTTLVDYQQMLEQKKGTATANDGTTAAGAVVYDGVFTAQVQMTMSGSRAALQQVLDNCVALEPKLRVTEFLFQNRSRDQNDSDYQLSISMELYMSEDPKTYLEESAAALAAAQAQANATANGAAATNSTGTN